MFTAVKALLLSKSLKAKRHKGAIVLFHEHFVVSGVMPSEMESALRIAKDKREKSDYEVEWEASKDEAEEQLRNAEEFISKVKEILLLKNRE